MLVADPLAGPTRPQTGFQMKSRFYILVQQIQKVKKLQTFSLVCTTDLLKENVWAVPLSSRHTLECHGFAQLDGHSGNQPAPFLGGLTVWPRGLSLTLKIGR